MSCSIELRNKAKEVVAHTIVSEEDYEELSKYKWYKNSDGYAAGNVNKKIVLLHRYIMINILGNNITPKIKVDHIDKNRLNNIRNNLQTATDSENNRNRVKKENTTSQYIGVMFRKSNNKWQAGISINKKLLYASYNSEHHAGHQYNLWCKEYELKTANLNSISDELVEDFIQYVPTKKLNDLPRNITLTKSGNFNVRINNKNIGNYSTLNEAIEVKENALKEIEAIKLNEILSKPILRNEAGECVINIISKNVNYEMIVDEDDYYELIQYGITYNDGYAQNGKLGKIHRYVMKYEGNHSIDHINGNKLDNRKSNLRVATATQNAMNRNVSDTSISKYVGVYLTKSGKYRAQINRNHLGTFENEIDAAKARDVATKEMFGEFGKLNFPEDNA